MLTRWFWLSLLCICPAVVGNAQEALPRVLILGDSTYQQPAREITKALQGTAEVVFPALSPGEIRNTHFALKDFDRLIGQKPWNVIHFNFGLGDLVYRAPRLDSFRILPAKAGGVRASSPDIYRTNLEQLVVKLKSTGAELIWASTTPIRHSATGVFEKGSEVEYNRIAEQVMKKSNIPINDMHAAVSRLIDMQRPASHGADPFHFDRKPIYPPVLKSIQDKLKQ